MQPQDYNTNKVPVFLDTLQDIVFTLLQIQLYSDVFQRPMALIWTMTFTVINDFMQEYRNTLAPTIFHQIILTVDHFETNLELI